MKTLTAAVQSILAGQQNYDAMIVVKIEWPTTNPSSSLLPTPEYYGDKTTTIGSIQVIGAITSMSPISSAVGPDYSAAVSTVSVSLIDPGGLLYLRTALLSSAPLEVTPVTVYLYVSHPTIATGEADLVELLKGQMGSPIRAKESDATFSFDIVSAVTSKQATYVLDQELDPLVPDESDGAVIPICFGVPRDVPAVLFRRGPQTRIIQDTDSADTKISIEDGDTFPAGVKTLRMEDEFLTGSIANDEITVTARNVNKFSNLVTGPRPGGDIDATNPFVIYCADASQDHTGAYVIFDATQVPGTNSSKRASLCVAQKGKKLVFDKPWTNTTGANWLVGAGVTYDVRRYAWEWIDKPASKNAYQWTIQAGASVTQPGNDGATYLVSSIPAQTPLSSTILAVRAYRTYQQGRLGITSRQLVAVPTSLWTASNALVQLPDGQGGLTPASCLQIVFPTALSSLNQGWDDGRVFVTFKSSVGTNPSEQIAYLLQNKTNISVDVPSFTAVFNSIVKYRADFAVLGESDALALCHDIAYQARCALLVFGTTAKIRYLSRPPTSTAFVLRNNATREDSFDLTLTPDTDIATSIKARWRVNYTGEKERKYPARANVPIYGVRPEEREFYIYQRKSLVKKSATFWVNRRSRTWKLIEVEADLQAIVVEPLDGVQQSMNDIFITDPTLCEAWSVDYSSLPHAIRLQLWVPFESGSNFITSNAYLTDTGDPTIGDPAPKSAKSTIARICPFPFTMVSEPLQTAVPCTILKLITSKTAEIALFPQGLSGPQGGTAFLSVLGIPSANFAAGKSGVAWRLPDGSYVSDVFAGG